MKLVGVLEGMRTPNRVGPCAGWAVAVRWIGSDVMCGRYALEHAGVDLAAMLDVAVGSAEDWAPSWNIAPTTAAPVMIRHREGVRLDRLGWGFTSVGDHGRWLINARSETVDRKPSFQDAIRHQRIVIPISGFYEWARRDGRKLPYAVRSNQEPLLLLAGIWSAFKTSTGEVGRGFCILTRAAEAQIAAIHDRMPVMLDPDAAAAWMSPASDSVWRSVLDRGPSGGLAVHPVSSRVNSTVHDAPDLLDEVVLPAPESPGLFDRVERSGDLESPDKTT